MDPIDAQRLLEEFVSFLCERRDIIAEEWLSSIRRDGRLQTPERLTSEELKEHFFAFFDDLVVALKTPAAKGVKDQADQDARDHGRHRFWQNYRLDELVREIAAKRTAFIAQIIAFEEQTPEFQGMVKRVALQRLHGFLDNQVADAAEQFTQEQQGGLRKDLAASRENTTRERGERQEAEAELRTAESETEQFREVDSARLHLLRTVAHELRNSLNATQLTLHDLAEEENADVRKELISMLMRTNSHMEALLKDLLNYTVVLAEPKFARMEPVLLPELYEDMVAMYRPLAEVKGLILKAAFDPALTVVISHRTKIVQIVSNLLSNAIKYTSSGTVSLSFIALEEARWSVVVEDTGPGIPSEEHEQVFTEFHRVPQTAHMEGTGLGLALVKRLTNLLGGQVRLESELGRGSRFEVILPQQGCPE